MRKLILIAKVRPSAGAKFAQETHLIGGGPPRGAAKPCFSLSENTRRRMILYQRDQVVHCSRPLSPFPSPFSLLLSYHSLSLSLSHSFILSPYFSLSFSPSISLCYALSFRKFRTINRSRVPVYIHGYILYLWKYIARTCARERRATITIYTAPKIITRKKVRGNVFIGSSNNRCILVH